MALVTPENLRYKHRLKHSSVRGSGRGHLATSHFLALSLEIRTESLGVSKR